MVIPRLYITPKNKNLHFGELENMFSSISFGAQCGLTPFCWNHQNSTNLVLFQLFLKQKAKTQRHGLLVCVCEIKAIVNIIPNKTARIDMGTTTPE